MPSFDGKTLDEFYKTDYDYLEGRTEQRGNRPPTGAEVAIDLATGGGPRAEFFRPLTAAGIPRDRIAEYAKKAEIKNVNSDNDFAQIIDAWKKDQMKKDDSSMDEMEEEDKPIVFEKTEREKEVEANADYLKRIAMNNRRGISNYVFGSKNPRQNVFNDDGSVKSDDDDMRDKNKDDKAMDFANRYKEKMMAKLNRFDRAMG